MNIRQQTHIRSALVRHAEKRAHHAGDRAVFVGAVIIALLLVLLP